MNKRRKRILFLVGSYNQTTQMHQIASFLGEYDCYFSQFYTDNLLINEAISMGLLESTILSGQFKRNSEEYLKDHGLLNDYRQQVYKHSYDLIVVCSDLLLPKSIFKTKTIWVQEGMTDKLTAWGRLVSKLDLPRYLSGGTSLNGTSNLCDLYCVASPGYANHFKSLGTSASKIIVTGMPNFDNANSFLENNFPYKNYVLVATSDIRETFGFENRKKFIKKAIALADGRQLIFKLHPNEHLERAKNEIKSLAPANTLILQQGNTSHMIANCDELVTQYSSVVYIGLALNKKVHSYFNIDDLKKLMPIQNKGKSAFNIANICKGFIEFTGDKADFVDRLKRNEAAIIKELATA